MQNDMNTNNNFYFIHGTKDTNSILSIINEGVIKPGKYVPVKRRLHGGDEPLDYIYTVAYFEDIHNLSHIWDYAIILSPILLRKYNVVFNKGWQGSPWINSIYFNIIDSENYNEQVVIDTVETFNNKLNEVIKFIKDPNTLPKIIQDAPGLMHHEFLFSENIPLKDNIIGIVCNNCSKTNINKIKNALKKNSFYNIPIFTKNHPVPTLEQLIDN